MVRDSIILFADDIGIPLVLEALGDTRSVSLVIDPEREPVQDWITRNRPSLHIMHHPDKKDRAGFLREIMNLKPRLGIVASYSRILWPALIDQFALGIVNLHFGKLPQYRGANVLQWAIINGETETAVTLHYVDKGIDTGPIIQQIVVPIETGDTALILREKMRKQALRLLTHWIPKLLNGRVHSFPQDESKAKVWPRRRPEEGTIDWTWSDALIQNMSRALVNPWPGIRYRDHRGEERVIDQALSLEEIRALRQRIHH